MPKLQAIHAGSLPKATEEAGGTKSITQSTTACIAAFAQTREAYDQACNQLFATLDEIGAALETSRYLW